MGWVNGFVIIMTRTQLDMLGWVRLVLASWWVGCIPLLATEFSCIALNPPNPKQKILVNVI